MKRLALLLWLFAGPAVAVNPDEMLDDPALEARARDISAGLRCPVCQNESIDESNAPLARDLRLLVRERLLAGDTDAEATDFIAERYGDYVLLRPRARGATWALWLAGPALLLIGLGVGWRATRQTVTQPDGLSDEEKARLKDLL